MSISSLAGLSLRDLEYAVAVARLRHFGRAAQACGVSQPSLSEQIRKLEALLGVVLFERGRRVAPTARGAVVLEQAARVLAEARNLLETTRAEAEPLTGTLRLGLIATLGAYYLPFLLPQLRMRFPRLTLRLREGQTTGLLSDMQDGGLDAVLLALPSPVDGVACVPLFFEPFLLACPAGHALAEDEPVALDALAGQTVLLLEEGHCLRDQAASLCHLQLPAGAEAGRHVASSLEMLRHMVAAAEGVSLMPRLAAQPALASPLVAYRPVRDADAGRTIALAWRGTDPRGPEFDLLAAFLRETLPQGTRPAAASDGDRRP